MFSTAHTQKVMPQDGDGVKGAHHGGPSTHIVHHTECSKSMQPQES